MLFVPSSVQWSGWGLAPRWYSHHFWSALPAAQTYNCAKTNINKKKRSEQRCRSAVVAKGRSAVLVYVEIDSSRFESSALIVATMTWRIMWKDHIFIQKCTTTSHHGMHETSNINTKTKSNQEESTKTPIQACSVIRRNVHPRTQQRIHGLVWICRITVLQFPPKESRKMEVIMEFRYGICWRPWKEKVCEWKYNVGVHRIEYTR